MTPLPASLAKYDHLLRKHDDGLPCYDDGRSHGGYISLELKRGITCKHARRIQTSDARDIGFTYLTGETIPQLVRYLKEASVKCECCTKDRRPVQVDNALVCWLCRDQGRRSHAERVADKKAKPPSIARVNSTPSDPIPHEVQARYVDIRGERTLATYHHREGDCHPYRCIRPMVGLGALEGVRMSEGLLKLNPRHERFISPVSPSCNSPFMLRQRTVQKLIRWQREGDIDYPTIRAIWQHIKANMDTSASIVDENTGTCPCCRSPLTKGGGCRSCTGPAFYGKWGQAGPNAPGVRPVPVRLPALIPSPANPTPNN